MKRSIAVIGLMVFALVAFSQSVDVDSLTNLIGSARADTAKVGLLQRSGARVANQRPELALEWASASNQLSRQLGFRNGEAAANLLTARVMARQGRLDKATVVTRQGLAIYLELEDSEGMVKGWVQLADMLCASGKPDAAFVVLDSAMNVSVSNPIHQLWVYKGLAAAHQQADNTEKALGFLHDALAIAEKSVDKSGEAAIHEQLAILFGLDGQYQQSEQEYGLALSVYQQQRDAEAQGRVHTKMSGLRRMQGGMLDAKEHLIVALELFKEANNKHEITRTYLELGQLYLDQADHRNAKESAELGMRTANDIGFTDGQLRAANMLSEIYQGLGDFRKAYLYQDMASKLKGELLNESMVEQMQTMETAHRLEEQLQQIELQKANLELKEAQQAENDATIASLWLGIGGTVVGACLLVMVILLLINRSRSRQRANERLQVEVAERTKAEEQLRELNNELNTLMYKSSHDLKSPLASAIGLSNVAKLDVTDEMGLKYINMISDRISYLDNMLTNLINTSKIRSGVIQAILIDFPQLMARILESIDQMHGYDTITVETDISLKNHFYSDTGMLTTIIQNLVTNAVKYQDNSRTDSYCHIKLRDTANGVSIRIEDNGIGIDDKIKERAFDMFYRATSQSDGSGLGLYIVMSSVKKVKGTINLETSVGVGTTITIELPTLKKPDDIFIEVGPVQHEDSES